MGVTIGLTGGIASGKSVVAQMFRDLGVPVVDADAIARDVVKPGSEALAEIEEAFGREYLLREGTLDRKKLGELVFRDESARRTLNAITHPRIATESARQVLALQATNPPYVLYEAALLIENGLQANFGATVLVSADPEQQLSRLMTRDSLSETEARARIATQLPLEKKKEAADFIVDNGGDFARTREQVRTVHAALVARFGESRP